MLTVQVAGTSYAIDEPAFKYSPKLTERWRCQIYIWDYTGTVFFPYLAKVTVTDPVLGRLFVGFVAADIQDKTNTYPDPTTLHQLDCFDPRRLAENRTSMRQYTTPTYAGKIAADMIADVLQYEGVIANYATQFVSTQNDWQNNGTLSGAVGAATVGDGDLELANTGSPVTASYVTQANWATGTAVTIQENSDGTVQLIGAIANFNDGNIPSRTLYGNGAPTDGVNASGQYELTCTKQNETRSRLDFAGTWSGNYTIEVDINVQGDVPRRGVTWQTTNFGNGDGGYGYAVEVLSTSIEIRRGTNSSAGGTSTQLASHTFSPKLAYGWYRLKVVKNGSTYTVSLAGVQYLSVTDATYSAAAYLALRNRNGETNVSITDQYDNFGVMQSKTGSWQSPSVSINSVATVAYSIITWDQSLSVGAFPLVQSSIDGGTTWKTCTSGAFLPLLGKGASGTGKSVLIKVTFSVTSTQFMPIIRNLVWTVSGGYVASGTRTTVPLAIDYMQRANQSGFGTASDGQTYTKSGTGTDAISSNEATITNTTGDVYERLGSKTAADSEASTRFELSASTIFAGVCLRFTDSNNLYRCIYNNGTLKLEKLVAGVLTTLASASVSPFSVTWSRLRLRIVGSTLYGRMWPDGIVESTSWMLTTTDSAFASGGFALFANGTGVASFDDFRVTSYPDPALALEPVGRLGSSFVSWNSILPSPATTLGMYTSLRGDGSDWFDVSAQSGGPIPGLYGQPDPTIDGFGVDSHMNYTATNQTGGAAPTATYDTAHSRVTLTGGTNGIYLYNAIARADIDELAVMDTADAGGLVWRFVDANNFYCLVVSDHLASVGTPQRATLYSIKAGVQTQLAQATIPFVRSTFHIPRVTMLGGVITATWDGAALFSYTDASPLGAGNVGLFNSGGATGSRYYQLWIQPQGDLLLNTYVYTKESPATTDATVTPQVLDMTVAAFNPNIGPGALIPAVDYRHQFMDKVGDDLVKQ